MMFRATKCAFLRIPALHEKKVGLMVHFAYRCVQMDNGNNLNTDFGHWQLSCQYCVPTVSDNSTESGGKGSKKCHNPENAYWI